LLLKTGDAIVMGFTDSLGTAILLYSLVSTLGAARSETAFVASASHSRSMSVMQLPQAYPMIEAYRAGFFNQSSPPAGGDHAPGKADPFDCVDCRQKGSEFSKRSLP